MANNHNKSFVHVLLFQCPSCENAIAIAQAAPQANLEDIDATTFDSRCFCGWSGELIGIRARRHWVESWPEME